MKFFIILVAPGCPAISKIIFFVIFSKTVGEISAARSQRKSHFYKINTISEI